MNLAAKLALMRAARTEHDGAETFAIVTRVGNENVTATWDELAEVLEVLRELAEHDPVTGSNRCEHCDRVMSPNVKLAHTDDCPVTHARNLVEDEHNEH